ncbi:MAG: hypothetical protein V4482_03970 [Pseudomonadota bacterium]
MNLFKNIVLSLMLPGAAVVSATDGVDLEIAAGGGRISAAVVAEPRFRDQFVGESYAQYTIAQKALEKEKKAEAAKQGKSKKKEKDSAQVEAARETERNDKIAFDAVCEANRLKREADAKVSAEKDAVERVEKERRRREDAARKLRECMSCEVREVLVRAEKDEMQKKLEIEAKAGVRRTENDSVYKKNIRGKIGVMLVNKYKPVDLNDPESVYVIDGPKVWKVSSHIDDDTSFLETNPLIKDDLLEIFTAPGGVKVRFYNASAKERVNKVIDDHQLSLALLASQFNNPLSNRSRAAGEIGTSYSSSSSSSSSRFAGTGAGGGESSSKKRAGK